jgi:hypothetical protein
MRIRQFAAALALGTAALGLSACATGLNTQVSRYSAMPVPAGQTFYVVPASGTTGGLEFGRFASIVSQQLQAKGYRPAGSPQLADMLVKVSYDVDEGQTEVRTDRMMGSRFADPFYGGFYDPFYSRYYGRPYFSRFGYYSRYRDPFYYGWGDPFYDPMRDGSIREYTTYKSELDVDIVRRADNASLFEGKAQAKSATDDLGVLVPNLIEAMFTNFPGRSGETVKITVPARKS